MILFSLGTLFSLLFIVKHFVLNIKLSTKLGKLLFFIEILLVFIIQLFDGSFVTQIYFYILITYAVIEHSYKLGLITVLSSYTLYVMGRYIYFYFPEFSAISFVVPRALEYILVFSLSCLTKHYIEQRNELHHKKEELQATNEKLKEALKEVEEKVLLKERTRISREMHDSVGHALTNALITLELGERLIDHDLQVSKGKLKIAKEQVKSGLEEVRKSVRLLREDSNHPNFVATVLYLIKEVEKHSNIKIHQKIAITPTLTKEIEHVLYRALQEGITNGLKHGVSSSFEITLIQQNNIIEFTLKDNGRGTDKITFGFGLTAMKERVEELNGSMNVTSHANQGTSLYISLPIPALKPNELRKPTYKGDELLRGEA